MSWKHVLCILPLSDETYGLTSPVHFKKKMQVDVKMEEETEYFSQAWKKNCVGDRLSDIYQNSFI